MCNEKFELPNGSYSVSGIQDYFEYLLKKHEKMTVNPPVRIYINKIKNRITFKVERGYYFKLSSTETMKLLEVK